MYDDRGNKTWEMDLDIYGKVRTVEGSSLSECPFRYQGQYEDEETGLYYNRFRYFDPDTGNYLSQDPIGLAGGNPTLYGYVRDVNIEIDNIGLKRGIHGVAPDYATKGLHGTFDGIELAIKPGSSGDIVYKNIFSKDVDISNAIKDADNYFTDSKNIEKALHNLEGGKNFYDQAGKGREWRELKRNLEKLLNGCR
jgi:RHS repeat-associated protein